MREKMKIAVFGAENVIAPILLCSFGTVQLGVQNAFVVQSVRIGGGQVLEHPLFDIRPDSLHERFLVLAGVRIRLPGMGHLVFGF